MADYRTEHARSIEDPEGYWGEQAGLVDWIRKPRRILDDDHPPFYRWFPDATLNTCYNALDRHVVRGHGDRTALVYDSAVADTRASYTYARLLERTAAFAGALRGFGVGAGDRVVIYMPMIPEAVIAMLACARIGAVHSVVFGGFAPHELAVRVDDARPTVIVTASCGIEPTRVVEYKPIVDRALEMAEHQPAAVVVKQRPQAEASLQAPRDVDWDLAMKAGATDPAECVEVKATDPLYVLYTSGTTGQPEGHRPRQRRPRGGDGVVAAEHLRRARRPGLVDRLRRGLGGRPLLHRLRTADQRRDHRPLRGQAGRHPRCRGVLAGDRRARRRGAVHRADRDPGDQEGGRRTASSSPTTT